MSGFLMAPRVPVEVSERGDGECGTRLMPCTSTMGRRNSSLGAPFTSGR